MSLEKLAYIEKVASFVEEVYQINPEELSEEGWQLAAEVMDADELLKEAGDSRGEVKALTHGLAGGALGALGGAAAGAGIGALSRGRVIRAAGKGGLSSGARKLLNKAVRQSTASGGLLGTSAGLAGGTYHGSRGKKK